MCISPRTSLSVCIGFWLALLANGYGQGVDPGRVQGPRELRVAEGLRPLFTAPARRLPPLVAERDEWPLTADGPAINALHLEGRSGSVDPRWAVAELPLEGGGHVRPVHAQADSLPAPPSGQVTLHLNEVSVRQALEMLSRSHNLNILVAPGVTGQVTANLEGMSVDQALRAIMKLCNLVAFHEDNLVYVYGEHEFPKQELRIGVFRLDYVAGSQVLPVVQSLLSPIGQAFITEISETDNRRTQEAVVVTDSTWILRRVEEYLMQVDLPPRQVMIEAHVLQIKLSEDARHGVDYRQAIAASGSSLELDVTGFGNPLAAPAVFARIDGTRVDALLHLLKTTTDAKTLASPRIMVVNGQKARIQVGEQLGYKVVTVTETAAVEEVKFLEVGVVLEVTPRISRDGRVLMRVKPEVSDGVINPDTLLPQEETSELESDVLLIDGQGVVIGGLIQERDEVTQHKVPFLGDLYLIGRLFQRRETHKERNEIVVTLVPRICDLEMGMSERDVHDLMRAGTPLLHGPLCRVPRPWEPRMPDAIENPRTISPFQPLHCLQCRAAPCECIGKGKSSGHATGAALAPHEQPHATVSPTPEAAVVPMRYETPVPRVVWE